jgi:hypothetical protein
MFSPRIFGAENSVARTMTSVTAERHGVRSGFSRTRAHKRMASRIGALV